MIEKIQQEVYTYAHHSQGNRGGSPPDRRYL